MRACRFYIDTNVFIVLVEIEGSAFETFLEKAARLDVSLVTSEITLAELLVKPLRNEDRELAAFYEEILETGRFLTVVPVDRAILRDSARLRVGLANQLADAIHVSTALRTECDVFVSSDTRLNVPATLPKLSIGELDTIWDQ